MQKSELIAEYRPYDCMEAFHAGWSAYEAGDYTCPFSANSVDAQAWDRGLECCMRWQRQGHVAPKQTAPAREVTPTSDETITALEKLLGALGKG